MTDDEIERIQVGDVLQAPSGDMRVVREVKTGPSRGLYPNSPYYFSFAIRHCSWTGRADTVKTRSEVRKWRRVGVRVKLDQPLDVLFAHDLSYRHEPLLDCCDAKGMP